MITDLEAMCVACGHHVRSLLGSEPVSIDDNQNYFKQEVELVSWALSNSLRGASSHWQSIMSLVSKYPSEEARKEDANGVMKWYKAFC